MQLLTRLLLIGGCALFCGVTAANNDAVDPQVSDIIARNVLNFAQNVGKLQNGRGLKTEIFSPLSLMSTLTLIMLGAKGRSYQQLFSLFGNNRQLLDNPELLHQQFSLMLKDLQQQDISKISPKRKDVPWRRTGGNKTTSRSSPFAIHVANGLFVQEPYTNSHFIYYLYWIYQTEQMNLDFQRMPAEARNHINDWVRRVTNGEIPKIIDGNISHDTMLILASAVYFQASWQKSFIEASTKLDNFYPDGANQPAIQVPMMVTSGSFPYFDSPDLGCRIVGLPYSGTQTTMYIIQPYQSTRARLQQLQQQLSVDKVEYMIENMAKRMALLFMPKMHLKRNIKIKELLKIMGVSDIFTYGVSDLSLIGDRGVEAQQSFDLKEFLANRPVPSARPSDLYVGDIAHKVDIDINERGTVAAAATVTTIRKNSMAPIRIDTPFLLLVRHDPTKLVLFYGIINEPRSAAAAAPAVHPASRGSYY